MLTNPLVCVRLQDTHHGSILVTTYKILLGNYNRHSKQKRSRAPVFLRERSLSSLRVSKSARGPKERMIARKTRPPQ